MSRWLVRIGCVVVVLGLLLSPIEDSLPIDFPIWLSHIFSLTSSGHVFLRVVPVPASEKSYLPQIILVVLGIVLVASGRAVRSGKVKK
jgi:hypothetical protein